MAKASFRWFQGGKLNSAVNCVDRHAAVDPDRVALIWEKDEPGEQEYITYKFVCQIFSNFLFCIKFCSPGNSPIM